MQYIEISKEYSIIELQSNYFTGSLDWMTGNVDRLSSLKLDFNMFSGTIPLRFGKCVYMHMLLLYLNINAENMTNMESIFLQSNLLTGSLPTSIGKF